MNAIVIAARIDGDTVTMRRDEFERLVGLLEDAQDVASADAIGRKLATGEEETVPSVFVDRMLSGESLVRLWREHRGLSVAELAGASGVPPTTITQVEDGAQDARIGDLKRIGAVLGLGLDDLVR